MASREGETSKQSKQGVNYEKVMNQALSEIFQNLKEIKQDTKRQRDQLLLERRRGSAPSSVLRKPTTTLQLPKNELSRSTSNMLWVLQCEEEDALWMTGEISLNFEFLETLSFEFNFGLFVNYLELLVMVETAKDQLLYGDLVPCSTYPWKTLAELVKLSETDYKFSGLLFRVQRTSENRVRPASLRHVLLRTTNIPCVYWNTGINWFARLFKLLSSVNIDCNICLSTVIRAIFVCDFWNPRALVQRIKRPF